MDLCRAKGYVVVADSAGTAQTEYEGRFLVTEHWVFLGITEGDQKGYSLSIPRERVRYCLALGVENEEGSAEGEGEKALEISGS